MLIENAVDITVAYKVESTYGTPAGASGAQTIRRVRSGIIPAKDSYQSNEVAEHLQVQDLRHGMRRPGGPLEGEMSPLTYADWFEALLRGTWAAGATFTAGVGTGITVANAGKTFTRASGSFLTDGFRVGDVVRWTGLTGVSNLNYRIVALTATVMTVAESPGADIGAPDESCSCSVAGQKLLAPTAKASIVKRSFSLETVFPDTDWSELYTGLRFTSCALGLPPTGIMTCQWGAMAQDVTVYEAGSSPYFSSPSAATETGLLAAVDGILRVGGTDVAIITGFDLAIDIAGSQQPVVGSNVSPDVFTSRLVVTGTLSFVLDGATLVKNFINEDAISAMILLEEAEAAPASLVAVHLPKIKFSALNRDIGNEGPVIVGLPFQALLPATQTGYDRSTIVIQDSDVT